MQFGRAQAKQFVLMLFAYQNSAADSASLTGQRRLWCVQLKAGRSAIAIAISISIELQIRIKICFGCISFWSPPTTTRAPLCVLFKVVTRQTEFSKKRRFMCLRAVRACGDTCSSGRHCWPGATAGEWPLSTITQIIARKPQSRRLWLLAQIAGASPAGARVSCGGEWKNEVGSRNSKLETRN